jgi:hypothetical protein
MKRSLYIAVLAATVGLGMWSGSEAIALASTPDPAPPGVPLGTTSCQPAKIHAFQTGQKVGLTLAEARSCWPRATVSENGVMTQPGEYVIRHGFGWVHAGFSVGAPIVAGRTQSSRDALAYACGTQLGYYLKSWEQWATYVAFTTGNTVSYCNSAWNNWKNPICSGFGACQPPQMGVIGNYTQQVNPWYNQLVIYIGAMSETFYCRHYLSSTLARSAWCD